VTIGLEFRIIKTVDLMNIGILYICTGNYIVFWEEFYKSCEQFLLTEDVKYYFVFTDAEEIYGERQNCRIKKIFQENMGWPDNTLKRYHIFMEHESDYDGMDYLFFFNANLEVKRYIGRDFLPPDNLVLVTQHPGYYNKTPNEFPYETNRLSTAYVETGRYYIAGGLNGASKDIYLDMCRELKENVDADLEKGYIAKWHDESHINAYICKHDNYKIIHPGYLYPEGWNLPFTLYIMIRDKQKYGGHAFLRNGILEKFCKMYGTIYIYGAGKKGNKVRRELAEMGMNQTSFVISDGQEKNGEGIIYISELKSDPKDTGIIIALSNDYQGIARLNCIDMGYCNLYMY
jgi:hypothetical protein